MSQVGAPKHAPIPIGEIAQPPFVRLPDPSVMFAQRAARLRERARGHELGAYLHFLAGLSDAQHNCQGKGEGKGDDGLPPVALPTEDALARAREFAMPPLDRNGFVLDTAFDATFARLSVIAERLDMPAAARTAMLRVRAADIKVREEMVRSVLADSVPVEALADHVFVAAALQVHFARMAGELDAKRLVPVDDGACPVCGGAAPVASLVVGWNGAHGTRYCSCSLCGTLRNYVRIKCTLCGSTKGINYQEIAGGPGTVKAETCDSCRGYVKILHQHVDPALDPVADDAASLALDLLVRDTGYRRGAVNPFLLGY